MQSYGKDIGCPNQREWLSQNCSQTLCKHTSQLQVRICDSGMMGENKCKLVVQRELNVPDDHGAIVVITLANNNNSMIIAVKLSHRGFISPGSPQGCTWGQSDKASIRIRWRNQSRRPSVNWVLTKETCWKSQPYGGCQVVVETWARDGLDAVIIKCPGYQSNQIKGLAKPYGRILSTLRWAKRSHAVFQSHWIMAATHR